jgi:ELWxxDGT repeat protein
MIRDLNRGTGSGFPPQGIAPYDLTEWPIAAAGDVCLFAADDGNGGREFWQTSGTFETTGQVADVFAGATSGNPHVMATVTSGGQTRVLFASNSPQYGRELFTSTIAPLPSTPPAWLDAAPGATYRLEGDGLHVTSGNVSLVADLATTHARFNLIIDAAATVTTDTFAKITTLQIAPSGNLDLKNSGLAINYDNNTPSPLPGITALIQSARNGGSWGGDGITSSTITPMTTVGLSEAKAALSLAQYATGVWHGQTVDDTSILIVRTYVGDTNLDGVINGDDYFNIDSGYGGHATSYSAGDLDYNGKINADDYFLIDSNYNKTTTPLGISVAAEANVAAQPETVVQSEKTPSAYEQLMGNEIPLI